MLIFHRICAFAFSFIVIGSVYSTEAAPIANNVKPLTLIFEGNTAPQHLADALKVLLDRHRDVILSSNATPQTIFWKLAIQSGAWPSEIDQPKSLELAFSTRTHNGTAYWIPEVHTKTIVTLQRVQEPQIPIAAKELSDIPPNVTQNICKKHGWLEPKTDCVVAIVPDNGAFSNRKVLDKPGDKNSRETREVVILVQSIGLLLDRLSSNEQRDLIETDLKNIGARVLSPNDDYSPLYESTTDGNAPDRVISTSPQHGCPEGSEKLRSSANLAKDLIRWPVDAERSIHATNLVVVDPDVGEDVRFPRLFTSNDTQLPEIAKLQLGHPYVNPNGERPFLRTCKEYSEFQKDATFPKWEHAVSVASVVFGTKNASINFNTPDQSVVQVSGFLEPVTVTYAPPSHFMTAYLPRKAVAIAPFETKKKENTYKIREAASEAFSTVITGTALLIAAPTISGDNFQFDNYYRLPHDLWRNGTDTCTDWPACVGATPFGLVVAALDASGDKLILADPGSGVPYKLGSAMVGVAAPGEDIVTAITSSIGERLFGIRSGTSIAVATVGALALKLQDAGYPGTGVELLARISATSDLGAYFDGKIRYGRVNASRALLANGGTDKHSVLIHRSEKEEKDINLSANSLAFVKGQNYTDRRCGDNAPLGYLQYFKPEEDYNNSAPIPCIPVHKLLRVRMTGQTENGDPLFTIVFYENGTPKFKNVSYPHIERNVRLSTSQDGLTVCMLRGGDPDSITFYQRPCLVRINNQGDSPEPIDLPSTDIIFSGQNLMLSEPNV